LASELTWQQMKSPMSAAQSELDDFFAEMMVDLPLAQNKAAQTVTSAQPESSKSEMTSISAPPAPAVFPAPLAAGTPAPADVSLRPPPPSPLGASQPASHADSARSDETLPPTMSPSSTTPLSASEGPAGALATDVTTGASSQRFMLRLLGRDPQSAAAVVSLAGVCSEDELPEEEAARAKLQTALAEEELPDPSHCIGNDAAARVVAHFCRVCGSDRRTLRTVVDVLLLLQPPLEVADLWLCLAAVVRRFAPMALQPGVGCQLMELCRLFESLLLFHDPQLALLFKKANVGVETYSLPWFCTAHATDLAEASAVLRIWESWLDDGEPLDPIFLGLARLLVCRDDFVLCGAVPELAQFVHAALGARQHAQDHVIDAVLSRAAQLKAMTPLSFLKKMQHVLLRAKTLEPERTPQQRPRPSEQRASGSGWLPGLRKLASPPPKAPVDPISCMRVEAQDVMMLETVKNRYLRKGSEPHTVPGLTAEGDYALISDSDWLEARAVAPDVALQREVQTGSDDVCRLLPRLIDLRHPAEAKRFGVRGSFALDVSKVQCVEEFIDWTHRRSTELLRFGLRPMHVLMTSKGVLSTEQSKLLRMTIAHHVPGICILEGGYASLQPFIVDVETEGDEPLAKDLLQKGLVGLNALWEKAPIGREWRDRVSSHTSGRTNDMESVDSQEDVFLRAPLPSNVAAAANALPGDIRANVEK